MITSINGLSNTPIQETTIQKENATENIFDGGWGVKMLQLN